MSTMQFHSSTLPAGHSAEYRSDEHSPQSPDLPRSATHQHTTHFDFSHAQAPSVPSLQHPAYLNDPSYHRQPLHSPQSQLHTPTSAASYFSAAQASPVVATFPASYAQSSAASYDAQRRYSQAGQYQRASYDAHADSKPAILQTQPMYQHTQPSPTTSGEGYSQYAEHRPSISGYGGDPRALSHAEYSQGGQYSTYPSTSLAHSAHSLSQSSQIPQHDVTRPDVQFLPQHVPALGMSRV
jgi:hypothetical protein